MPRRVSTNFSAGMITDVIGAENSLAYLKDGYVRRVGELCSRGPIYTITDTLTPPSTYLDWGITAGAFHPNFGTGICRRTINASFTNLKYQFAGAPLQSALSTLSVNPQLVFSPITENTDDTDVYLGYDTVGTSAVWLPFEKCNTPALTGEEMIFPAEMGSLYKWAGSLLDAYSTGTARVAGATAATAASGLASRIIRGSGTSWGTNVQAGQYIRIGNIAQSTATYQSRYFRIVEVIDDTTLEIETPLYATGSASAIASGYVGGYTYRIQSLAAIASPDGVWNQTNERPTQTGACAYHGGRLFVGGVSDGDTAYNDVFNFDRIRWSGSKDEQGTFIMSTSGTTAGQPSATAVRSGTEAFYSHLDLWHPNAYIDVFPGVGGVIRGMVSMGNELVIIKSHALVRLTGSLNYDGTGEGVGLQLISGTVGADGVNAWALTKAGLVIASTGGLFLYDGAEVKSLTAGRVQRYWDDVFPNANYSISAFDDKVIVNHNTVGTNSQESLVWQIDEDYFWSMKTPNIKSVQGITTYTVDDEFADDYMLCDNYNGTSNGLSIYGTKNVNHKNGYDFQASDTDSINGSPNIQVLTHPIPLADDPLSEGRVNNVLVHCIMEDSSVNTDMTVEVWAGNTSHGIGYSEDENDATKYTSLEYGIQEGTTDRVHRIPFDSMTPSPSARVYINSVDEEKKIRIYAIGIDYEPSNVQGPTA